MADIQVSTLSEDEDGFRFEVLVKEGGTSSAHQVSMSRSDFDDLGKGAASPEAFINDCFSFLLEREPKESILKRFDVREIGSYFPEFNEVVRAQRSR